MTFILFYFSTICLFFVKNIYCEVQLKEFSQLIDHENEGVGTWKQHYYENLEFFKDNGPIYIFIGGAIANETHFLYEGLTYELANETKGAIFMLEHRFYAGSLPFDTNDDDYITHLKYLSSMQAINDIEYFISHFINQEYPNRKIVLVGGSHPGNLAVWTKQLYPNIADAVIASSAPLLSELEFTEFYESVSESLLEYGGSECYDYVKNMFERYEVLLQTDEGRKIIQEDEKLCSETDLTQSLNQQAFMSQGISFFGGLVQYATDVGIIQETCEAIVSNKPNITDINPDLFNPLNCDFELSLKGIKDNRNSSEFHWYYQVCTELGDFTTTHSGKHAFGNLINIDLYFHLCQYLYGDAFDSSSLENSLLNMNNLHRGLNPNVENVVFVNGDLDPSTKLGVTQNLSALAPAILIHKASHGADLWPALDVDSIELTNARVQIKKLIKQWIGWESTV